MRRIVVVLAVQWGYPGDRPSRWFRINPRNHSGNRLIKLIGHNQFLVTNACADIVYAASGKGKPNATWLQQNLAALAPSVVLVCGAVAQATFKRGMVGKACKVYRLPHPAARTWRKADIARWSARIQSSTVQ
jgi:hypothetical protein